MFLSSKLLKLLLSLLILCWILFALLFLAMLYMPCYMLCMNMTSYCCLCLCCCYWGVHAGGRESPLLAASRSGSEAASPPSLMYAVLAAGRVGSDYWVILLEGMHHVMICIYIFVMCASFFPHISMLAQVQQAIHTHTCTYSLIHILYAHSNIYTWKYQGVLIEKMQILAYICLYVCAPVT